MEEPQIQYNPAYTQSQNEKPKIRLWIWILVCIIIAIIIIGFFMINNKKSSDNVNQPETSENNTQSSITNPGKMNFNQQIQDNLKLLGLENENNIIIINSSGFNPNSINIKYGEKIVWINEDSAQHSVTYSIINSEGTESSDSGPIEQNTAYGLSFSEVGRINYSDGFNPSNKGEVVVQ